MSHHKRSIPGIIFSAFFGLLFFFLIVLAFDYAAAHSDIAMVDQLSAFLNRNILLIVLMSLIFFTADLFRALFFPLNLPAPIFSAVASVFLVEFILRIFGLVEDFAGEQVFDVFRPFVPVIYVLVFFVALAAGYISIFAELCGLDKCKAKKETVRAEKEADRSWDDVGKEFRNMLYEAFSSAREEMEKEKK